MHNKVQSCFYTTADQLQCHYLLWPNTQSRSCCLLLHGFTNDAHIWDALAAKLQKQHNVIALDFRGHGDSDWDDQARYTHQQLCADTETLIKQCNDFDQWHIIGHSLGARIAMLMLAEGTTAASLTIIDTGPEVRAVGVNKVRQDAESFPTHFASQAAYYEFLANIYLFAQPERLQQLAHWGLKKGPDGQWIAKTDPAFTSALWKPADDLAQQQGDQHGLRYPMQAQLWQSLGRLECPVLVIRGQASAILSRDVAERMVSVIPDARLVVINRAGHAVPVDNPQAFEDAVCAFISEL